jgi:hypothetical protein
MRDDHDDPVTLALLGDSAYDRLRATRHSMFKQPIHKKLRWQSGLLVGLALVLPLMGVFPTDVQMLLQKDATLNAGAPKVVLLGLVGGSIVFIGGVTLTIIGVVRHRLEPGLTERQADRLLNVEEVASLLGIGTGGIGIVITLVLTAIGFGGVNAIQTYVEALGRSPFAGTGVEWLSVSSVATFAFIGSVSLFICSQYLHLELLLRLGDHVKT